MEKDSGADNPLPKQIKPAGGKGLSLLPTLIICLLVSTLSVLCYDKFYAQKLVAVDIKGYLAEQRDLFLAGKITEDQLKGNLDKLEKKVTSIPKNTVVLMGDAVVRNVEVVKP